MMIDDLVLARAIHVLALVHWIGLSRRNDDCFAPRSRSAQFFHCHVLPLMVNKVSYDLIDGLPQNFSKIFGGCSV